MTLETGAPNASPDATPSDAMAQIIDAALSRHDGWLPFDHFMALALYAPGAGYYAHGSRKFGHLPTSGSDFVTAPELSPLFGQTLAVQVQEALAHSGTDEVWEFGAGSGALAEQLLGALEDGQGGGVVRYTIVDLSGALRERQQARLAAWGDKVRWVSELPQRIEGVVVGNEVLDAMPVKLLHRVKGVWHERGVVRGGGDARGVLRAGGNEHGAARPADGPDARWAWEDRPTDLRPPLDIAGPHDYLTEIHPQARAWVATLAERLARGAAFLIDYGFPEAEYYHPQRHMGTVMCHQAHRSDDNPLVAVGDKDITAHVDFTGIALAGQDAGLSVLGYTSQAHFLLNCGLGPRMDAATLAERILAARLVNEHEMGEFFKVVGFAAGESWDAIGFHHGDRSHTL